MTEIMVNSISIFGDCYTGSGVGLRGLRVVTLPRGEPSGRWSGWGDPGAKAAKRSIHKLWISPIRGVTEKNWGRTNKNREVIEVMK